MSFLCLMTPQKFFENNLGAKENQRCIGFSVVLVRIVTGFQCIAILPLKTVQAIFLDEAQFFNNEEVRVIWTHYGKTCQQCLKTIIMKNLK